MSAPCTYPFPAELAALPRDRPAVIEASAGTGKTYLIEHLVVDRLVRGDARIDEMLVVTFTERAAAELVRRIRALITRVLRHESSADDALAPHAWTIDTGARERLEAALRGLDVAPISTIHAFCQRVLTEHAFASGRLLAQSQVESRTAFAAAFDDVIRSRLEGELASLLATWLAAGNDAAGMEQLLFQARRLRCEWAEVYDPERVDARRPGVCGDAPRRPARRGGARDQQQGDTEGDPLPHRRGAHQDLALRRARATPRSCSPTWIPS